MNRKPLIIVGIVWVLAILSCTRSAQTSQPWRVTSVSSEARTSAGTITPALAKRNPGDPIQTPTPDAVRVLPTLSRETQQYTVQSNDTLGQIAQRYGVSLDSIIAENKLTDPNHLEVGQQLNIPPADPLPPGPGFKIIPDSELVLGPSSANFDLAGFIKKQKGYISRYSEDIGNQTYDAAGVINRVAQDYSVNPRLLLAVIEYQTGWVTKPSLQDKERDYPALVIDSRRKGLYHQLTYTANALNRGYYLWRVNAVPSWLLGDNNVIPINPTINAGTAGVQNFFSTLDSKDDWTTAVGENGLFKTYVKLFGYPFDFAVEPLIPPDLKQPPMQLPFEPGTNWSFTGGPHAGWDSGSGWAAIDFAPPGEALGCVQSDSWEVAVADGPIVRSDNGAVMQDLDGDGLVQTGWTVLYMHVETRDRVQVGAFLHAGEHIGHPSCEGGISTGTHLHLARRYNGEWISADGTIPFDLDGWVSKGDGIEYNGFLVKNGTTVEAWEGRRTENQISR